MIKLFGNVIKLYNWTDSGRHNLKGKSYNGKPISIEILDKEIKDVCLMIEKIAGIKIVGPFPKGKLSIKLTDVPWDQVLDLVLDDFGFGFKEIGGQVKVYKRIANRK